MKLNDFNTYNLITEANKSLKIRMPKGVNVLNKLFKKNRKSLYLVGGAVRDAILGITPKDFDLATEAVPTEVTKMLNSAGISNFPKGEQFGVISAIIDNEEFEIATFRKDLSGGRRPDAVEFTSIDKDVLRRDLTINALFYDIDRGEVVDLVGGIKDLMDNNIRTVGNALDRFGEDPLRKLRALRFQSRLGAKLDPEVHDALMKTEWNNTPSAQSLGSVSKERIRDEFQKSISKAKSPEGYFGWLDLFNYWPFIFPNPNGNDRDTSYLNNSYIDSNDVDVQVATLLKGVNLNDNPKYGLQLKKQYAYSVEQIRTFEVLHSLMTFMPTDILDVKKMLSISKTSLKTCLEFAKHNQIDRRLVENIYKFKSSIKGNDPSVSHLSGKALGDKIKELEGQAFEKL